MDKHGTTIAELVRATGVSRDVINKMRGRTEASTVVENALLIAAYYGKDLECFMRMDREPRSALPALSDLLTPDEARLIEAQVRGILAAREPQ
jgi:plasmid maintenance system antidote protein VapI